MLGTRKEFAGFLKQIMPLGEVAAGLRLQFLALIVVWHSIIGPKLASNPA